MRRDASGSPEPALDPENRTPAEEAALIARCQQGDAAAFGPLIALYQNKVFATIYNVTRNEEDAWDLAQETFVRAWKNINRFRGQSSFFTWIYRIAMNVTIDRFRRKKMEGAVEFDETIGLGESIEPGSTTTPHTAASPLEDLQNHEIAGQIEAALDKLSPEHRMVIILRELEGLSYEEIAAATDCSLGTVMSRLFYARKKLQTLLHDVYEAI